MLSSECATRLKIFRVIAPRRQVSARIPSRAATAVEAPWAWAEDWSLVGFPGGQAIGCVYLSRFLFADWVGVGDPNVVGGPLSINAWYAAFVDGVSPLLRLARRPSRLSGLVEGPMGCQAKINKGEGSCPLGPAAGR